MNEVINKNILLVEDDDILAELICDCLSEEGYFIMHATNGENAINICNKHNFNLIICDLMLPDCHGFNLINKLNFSHRCPFIFLTALDDDQTHIQGLEKGAADFIAKPVDPFVLLARIKANLRHYNVKNDSLTVGEFTFHARNKTLLKAEHTIEITNQEFDILWLFIQNSDKPLTREFIFKHIVGRDYDGLDRAADLKISRLRKRLVELNCAKLNVETIRNQGYILTIDNKKVIYA